MLRRAFGCGGAMHGFVFPDLGVALSRVIIYRFCMVQDARLRPFQLLAQVKTMVFRLRQATFKEKHDRILHQGRSRQGERPCCQ